MHWKLRLVPGLLGVAVAVGGCATGAQPNGPASSSSPTVTSAQSTPSAPTTSAPVTTSIPPTSTPATSSPATPTPASVLAGMSEQERVGELLMVDCPSTGVAQATVNAIATNDVGSVILDNTNQLSVTQMAAITRSLQTQAANSGSRTKLLIATDQEGGEVQRLQGPGFSAIPSALDQGQIAPATLQADWTTWAKQLKAAGVNVDLGPVLDTVPPGFGSNPPIGDLDREYGHTPAVVSAHGVAVVAGLAAGGVDATVKHFPGLGRVRGNTDTTAGVTDTVTVRNDPYLAPYAAAVKAGAPLVMMSTAIYSKIDATEPAAFSKTIVTGILRGELGFKGVVISDDLGAAQQVASYTPGQRAVDFVAAGGDIVLTVDASQAPEMTAALLAKADADPSFKQLVDAAALRVLTAKANLGLL